MKSDKHISVLLREAIDGLNIKPEGIYVDCTLGRAGHSKEILKRLNGGRLIGFDQDDEAIEFSRNELSKISDKFTIISDNFRNFKNDLNSLEIKSIDGVLFDLGVSSPQFDEDYRGFSYNKNATLDMRMNQNSKLTAKDIVNNYSLDELCRVFREYGEEKYSYSIAKNIGKPKKELLSAGHPAKQVFQALRIEVNDELNALKEALISAIEMLNVNGRVVVITFQSLEDRIVKNIFRDYSVIEGNRNNDYINPKDLKTPDYRLVNKKVILPSAEEIEVNRRSKSAKMRIIEKIK